MTEPKLSEDITLEVDSELRLEIETKDVKVYITLLSGLAEMFGTELVKKKKYEFVTGARVAIFTYHGCVLNFCGPRHGSYVSKETPMIQYINCHSALEQMRTVAEEKDERGPVVMVVGPMDVGKSTLCRIFLNYAVRLGRRPLYTDVDIGQGSISIPGTIASILVERPASIEDGFAKPAPLVYHYGHTSPSANTSLYKAIISKMGEVALQSLAVNKRSKHSGIIINTCGWVKNDGYNNLLHIAQAFEVNAIFVLGQERLYIDLLRDIPSFVCVVLLPRSGGVVERNQELRSDARDARIKEYFYGDRTPLYPFSIEVKFPDLRLYKIGAPTLPNSCMPIGMKVEDYNKKLVAVTPSPSLLHHILSVSFSESIEDDVIGTNLLGFVCVTAVDMERQTVMLLSPQPRPLPNTVFLLSEIRFMDSHA